MSYVGIIKKGPISKRKCVRIIKTVTHHKIPNDSQILNLAYLFHKCETFMYVNYVKNRLFFLQKNTNAVSVSHTSC